MRRLAVAWPGLSPMLGLTASWAAALVASLLCGLWIRIGFDLIGLPWLIGLFAFGGFIAAAPAVWLSSLLAGRGGPVRRFVTLFLVLGLATFITTAGLFALQYRVYYSQWHEPFGTRVWAFQFAFTSASAVYQFAIFCLANGLVALLPLSAFSMWFARHRD